MLLLKFNETNSSRLNSVIYYFFLAFIISLFFKSSPAISNVIIGLILILVLFNSRKKDYYLNSPSKKIIFGFLIFFILSIISTLLSFNKTEGLNVLLMRLPLLVFSVIFFLHVFKKETWLKLLFFYSIATTIASVAGFFNGVLMMLKTNDSGFLYNDNISALLIGKQAVYFAFYVNCAIFIFLFLLFNKTEIVKKYKVYIIISIIWLFFINIMLASKTAMISLIVISFISSFYLLIKKKKYFEIVLIMFSILVGIFLISQIFPKILNRFKGITKTDFVFENKSKENHFNAEYDESKWNSTNTRVAIWSCAIEVWQDNLIMGTGIGDRDNALMQKYKEKNFLYAISTNKSTHNQYLDVLVSMGIIGLVAFLIIFFIYPIKIFFKYKEGIAISIIVCLAICFFTENMLNRYQGELIIAFLIPLVCKLCDEKEINTIDLPPDTF
jgi:O-antigen ligase